MPLAGAGRSGISCGAGLPGSCSAARRRWDWVSICAFFGTACNHTSAGVAASVAQQNMCSHWRRQCRDLGVPAQSSLAEALLAAALPGFGAPQGRGQGGASAGGSRAGGRSLACRAKALPLGAFASSSASSVPALRPPAGQSESCADAHCCSSLFVAAHTYVPPPPHPTGRLLALQLPHAKQGAPAVHLMQRPVAPLRPPVGGGPCNRWLPSGVTGPSKGGGSSSTQSHRIRYFAIKPAYPLTIHLTSLAASPRQA